MFRKLFGRARKSAAPGAAPTAAHPNARAFFSPALLQPENWGWPEASAIHAELLDNASGQLWAAIPHGHKWLNYFDAYDALFGGFRGKSPKVLEIGVDRGGSLILWQRFFGAGMTMVGIDINPDCAAFDRPAENIHVRIGSQSDPVFLNSIMAEFGPFDIIIDDGSHVVSHQIASFNALFDRGVKNGGIYMVEDLETSYWGQRTDHVDLPVTFIDFAREAVDIIHQPFVTHDYGDFRIEQTPGKQLSMPRLAKILDQVRFFDSIAAFYRRDRIPPVVEYLD